MTRTMAFLTAATLLLAFGLPSKAQEQPCTRSQVRLAVVHADDATGEQHLLGVRKALAELDSDKRICPVPIPYRGDRDGTKKLVEVITKKEAEIILGPTDSGAFQGAVEQEAELSQYQIPVISSLVTATGGNDRNGWFFRTNVDNKQRIARILDRTAPFAISSLGILYADTGFGRAAETQLRDDLATRFPPIYVTAVFEDNQESRRGAVKKILAQRPEALGIFGLAEDLTLIFEEIDEQARTVKYKPMSFTIVDASTVALSDHLLYWVSTLNGEADSSSEEEPKGEANPQGDKASGSEEQAISEIAALAYDTTGFLLQQLGSVTRQTFVPEDFRNDFAHLLRAGAAKPGELTGMDFDNFRNKANPGVFYRENGKIQKFEANLTFYEMTQHKFELVQRRFGDGPFLYAGASIVLCLMLTIVDVKRKYEGKYRKVLRHMWIYILCGAHVLILLALLLYLGETGKIQYDDWVAVLALAVAPTTLFRTTIVETPGGKAIGVKQYYERVLAWLNRRILDARHPRDTRRVAVLTYYNPYETMRLKLRANYDQQGDEQAPKLKANLDEKLESIESNATGLERLLRKRGVCARRLLRWFAWKDLYRSFVPPEYWSSFPSHPEDLIGAAVQSCASSGDRNQKVLDLIQTHLQGKREMEESLQEDVPKQATELVGHELYAAIQFLVMFKRWVPQDLIDNEILDEDYFRPTPQFWGRFKRWVRGFFGGGGGSTLPPGGPDPNGPAKAKQKEAGA